jgi:pimeloyl-ACP methyl ester carboxylesterase
MTAQDIQTVDSNGTKIAYELYGDEQFPVILLIHGLGQTMLAWPMAMVDKIVGQGFRVLRIDNRDQGHSQKFDHLKVPNMLWQTLKFKMGFRVNAPYPLTDLMKDTLGVLDALNIDSVHVVGASMGGMISQLLAINAPSRVKTLTSIMSTTGNQKLPGPTKDVAAHIMKKRKMKSKQEMVDYHIKGWQLVGSPAYPASQKQLEEFVAEQMNRGMSAAGTARQMLASFDTPNRADDLSQLKMPCLVIHGTDDPLIRVEGGIETADSIPQAAMHLIEGMGHDLPVQLHDQICGLIVKQANLAEEKLKVAS